MTDHLRWGILGTGWIARQMTADLAINGSTVTAVGSRTQEKADAYAAEFGIPHAHGSYEALVADPDVDVIYVATPHPSHVADATLALNAGKHVLLEKPYTINAAEARVVADLARERGLVVLEAMWTRWMPHMIRLREIIAAGTLGDVRTVIVDHNQKLSQDPTHRLQDPALGGGALLDLGIYPVSFAWDIFGAPTSIHAISSPTADRGRPPDRDAVRLRRRAAGGHAHGVRHHGAEHRRRHRHRGLGADRLGLVRPDD